ncbi:MAG: hypothetical protein ACXAC7_15120 [Candidatus Hodarchaeales archaeon]|jgi:hypothetical protein
MKNTKNKRYSIYSIIGVIIFLFLTLILPFFELLGGFLIYFSEEVIYEYLGENPYEVETFLYFKWIPFEEADFNYYWDHVTLENNDDLIYSDFSIKENFDSNITILWKFIPIWGIIWIFGIIIGSILVTINPFRLLLNKSPLPYPLALYGFFLGFLASFVEFHIFILLWFFENWGEGRPSINVILYISYIIGWLTLGLASNYSKIDEEA